MKEPAFSVAVKRDFIAQHYLIGGDWGAENELHSHHYQVEFELQSASLDEHGYLVDIVAIERLLEELVASYRDRTLNDLPEFRGQNPSIERFSLILCQELAGRLGASGVHALVVRLWENEIAWAACRLEL